TRQEPYRFKHLMEPIGSTPSGIGWHRRHQQVLDALWRHRRMLFRTRYGVFGWVTLPILWGIEIFRPLITVVATMVLVVLFLGGQLEVSTAGSLVAFGLGYPILLNLAGVIVDSWVLSG